MRGQRRRQRRSYGECDLQLTELCTGQGVIPREARLRFRKSRNVGVVDLVTVRAHLHGPISSFTYKRENAPGDSLVD